MLRKSLLRAFVGIAALTLLVFAPSAQAAATLYWDPLTTGGSASGGPGSWDTTNTFWSNGISSDSAWSNASGASTTAVFGGPAARSR